MENRTLVEMNKPRERTKTLKGVTYKISTGCGNIYVTINNDREGIFEIFAHLGKAGQCGAAQLEAICRCITAGLRAYVDPAVYVRQFTNISCQSISWDEGVRVTSCADAIGQALKKHLKMDIKTEVIDNGTDEIEDITNTHK